LFVGRLVKEKGILDLFEAVDLCEIDIRLGIVGGQIRSERDGVAAEVAYSSAGSSIHHDRVTLYGHLESDDLRAVLSTHDALVLPSYREGLPRSVIEALAAGRPAIVTDIRGSRELVADGINGLIVPPGDVRALSAAIRRMAELDASTFGAMSAAARRAATNYRESAVIQRLLETYENLGATARSTGADASSSLGGAV
jgi:glycosyltransferase involved in cell wall biosynthesis